MPSSASQAAATAAAAPIAAAPPGVPLLASPDDDHQVGTPKAWENLAVFPVTSKHQSDPGPLMTLEEALAKKSATVHEVGVGDNGAAPAARDPRTNAQGFAGGAQVNTLVIENKGTIPIYVLAGTLVKGGQQDRQIGQDFIVGANQTVPVDAFCVEHGRWTNQRDGVATAGQFGVAGVLTTSDVRAAAQYEHDQSQVWSKVAAVNNVNKKASASGTFFATVDASDVAAHRKDLAQKAESFLKETQPKDDVVGYAYAIDGQVRGVRWFASHKVFEMFRSTLLATAAMDAINAQAARPAGAPAPTTPAVAQPDVNRFVHDLQEAKVTESKPRLRHSTSTRCARAPRATARRRT